MIFGYARVSTQDQNLDLQLDAFSKFGVEEVFQEKMSGGKKDRPQLEKMIEKLRKGDKVVVYKLDRISRSTKHLIELSELFAEKEADFISIQDQIDTSTPMGRFFFRTMASIAELERDIIRDRTKAGLESARARGRIGGRPKKDRKEIEKALKLYDTEQYTVKEIEEMTSVSKATLYREIRKRNSNEEMV
ncbi:recombinase family protein [Cytobacillus praedii]|uniref:Recombinase family protein n=1 Tax=Cytobacillus praedii TaxID=1742358 RepID=A0A4R1ANS6_9BACI|nr:recombinase family protein [Cytobacillus praedii]TCJ01352.1 recombinase family protein [Cytobacillus praedii]